MRFFSTMSAISCATRRPRPRRSTRAGFAPTPVSVQVAPDGGPTGTGNVCAMMTRGYMEVLFKTADTPLGREFEAALGAPFRHPARGLRGCRRQRLASPARRGGFPHAADCAVQAAGRHRDRHRHRVVHGGAGRARRDGGRPHPDAHASHRGCGVAEALARASERRARAREPCDRGGGCRRGGGALCALHAAAGGAHAGGAGGAARSRADRSRHARCLRGSAAGDRGSLAAVHRRLWRDGAIARCRGSGVAQRRPAVAPRRRCAGRAVSG